MGLFNNIFLDDNNGMQKLYLKKKIKENIFFFNFLVFKKNKYMYIYNFFFLIKMADFKLALYTKYWTWINYLAWGILSLAIYYAWVFISNEVSSLQVYRTSVVMGGTAIFWLGIFLATGIFFMLDLFYMVIKSEFKKEKIDDIKQNMMKIKENKGDLIRTETDINNTRGAVTRNLKTMEINGSTTKAMRSTYQKDDDEKGKLFD
jgi:hypothetical protein